MTEREVRVTVVPHAVFRDTHYYALPLSQPAARECGVRCGVPFPACPQTRQARWLAAKERSNARVSPDHGSEGEDVQLRCSHGGQHTKRTVTSSSCIKGSHCSLRPHRTSSPGVSTAGPAGSAPMAITVLVVVQQGRADQLKYLAATAS